MHCRTLLQPICVWTLLVRQPLFAPRNATVGFSFVPSAVAAKHTESQTLVFRSPVVFSVIDSMVDSSFRNHITPHRRFIHLKIIQIRNNHASFAADLRWWHMMQILQQICPDPFEQRLFEFIVINLLGHPRESLKSSCSPLPSSSADCFDFIPR